MIDLGTLGGSESYALYVNNAGHVVGGAETASGDWHACLWVPVDGCNHIDMMILDLLAYVVALNIHQGIENSLNAKLNTALAALDGSRSFSHSGRFVKKI